MNNTGKAFLAVASLALISGLGWWALDRGQQVTGVPQAQSSASGGAGISVHTVDPDWLNEIDASIRLLSESLSASGNIGGAIALIDVLDARIARQPAQARLAPLRRALTADREKLVAARGVDVTAAATLIDQMVLDVDSLVLISAPKPLTAPKPKQPVKPAATGLPTWDELLAGLKFRFSEVVQIRRVENPEAVFLTPEQGSLVAERLRLRLLSARLALVSRQERVFQQDIGQAEKILAQAFDPQNEMVARHRRSMVGLKAIADKLSLPTLLAPAAVEALKRELAKPAS